jgi:hypothetical protein
MSERFRRWPDRLDFSLERCSEMEQATVETGGSTRTLGSRIARKIIAGWDGPAMRAVTIVARPETVLELPSNTYLYWPVSWLKRRGLEKRLGDRPWQGQELPEYMGLALDQLGILHLLDGRKGSGALAEITGELRQWPIDDVKVTLASDRGWWRVVEISDDTQTHIVLAPFVLPSQRAAMRQIAESSGTERRRGSGLGQMDTGGDLRKQVEGLREEWR